MTDAVPAAVLLATMVCLAGSTVTAWQARRIKGFRFPPEVISHGVWLYHRFPLSFRDVQELMPERGVDVS